MKMLKTIPIYNLRSQKLTSVTSTDFKAINDELVNNRFFEVQGSFIIVKNKFFKPEHLVRTHTFFIQGQEIHQERNSKMSYKKVLFILESPHRHEYDYENGFKAKKPLTGSFETFRNNFHKLMESISGQVNEAYEVTLYNPVPFQTSLHYLFKKNVNEYTRFNFWMYGWWNMKYHKDFENFLERYSYDFYINASTKSYKGQISFKLSSAISKEYQVYHPSSGFWNRQEARFGIKEITHLDDSHYLFSINQDLSAPSFN